MWLVYGAWSWLIVSSLVIFNTRGDVAAANHALPGLILVLLIHGGVWLYKKNKQPKSNQHIGVKPSASVIDDSIYDQIANEMSTGNINGGLMARAIAEADGDKDRSQAIYIKLRAAAIANAREQVRQDDVDKEAAAWKAQAEEDAKAFVDAQKSMSDSRTEFVKGMVRAEEDLSSDYSLRSPARRSWQNKLAHRVGLCFLWYTIVGLIGSILFTLFSVPDWSRFTTQEIGEFIAVSAMFLGLALLCYVGTLKLKW